MLDETIDVDKVHNNTKQYPCIADGFKCKLY